MKCLICRAETSDAAPYCGTCGAPTTGWSAPGSEKRGLRIAGAITAMVAAFPLGAVIFLPSYHYQGVAISFSNGIPAAFAAEPIGVTIVAVVAGIVMAWGRSAWRRVAVGMLVAFGFQMFLFSVGTQFGVGSASMEGSAGIAGMVGALMLVTAGVLGAVGSADRHATGLASTQGINNWPGAP